MEFFFIAHSLNIDKSIKMPLDSHFLFFTEIFSIFHGKLPIVYIKFLHILCTFFIIFKSLSNISIWGNYFFLYLILCTTDIVRIITFFLLLLGKFVLGAYMLFKLFKLQNLIFKFLFTLLIFLNLNVSVFYSWLGFGIFFVGSN